MIAPGFPVFVAGVFRIFGSYSLAAELTLISVNVLLNVLTVWLILRLSRRFAGERAALWAGTFWACSLPLLWLPTIFWDTSASTFLLLGCAELAMSLQQDARAWMWAAAGACCGVAGLINPALLPALLATAAWALWTGRTRGKLQKAVLALSCFLLIFSPWPIRNARVFHAWIATRTTIGIELWMGNHSGSTGFLDESLFPTYNATELASYRASGEVAYTNHKSELARQYIRTHLGVFTRLTILRAVRFWTGSGNRQGSPFFILHALLTALLGLAGAVLLLRSAHRTFAPALLLPLILFPLPYYLTHAEFRYRLVVDPLLTLLSAKTLQCLFARDWSFMRARALRSAKARMESLATH